MDEPLSNLDAKLRVQTRADLIDLQRQLQTTVVYVTHDQVEAMTMGHRIAVMKDGELQQLGPPQEVYELPANLFVAGFIGNPPMNTIPGVVTEDGSAVEAVGVRLPLSTDMARAITARSLHSVVIGARSEHLHFDASGLLPATVAVIESLGHERQVGCRLADGTLVIVRASMDDDAPRSAAVGADRDRGRPVACVRRRGRRPDRGAVTG